jgi:hypothetical protein
LKQPGDHYKLIDTFAEILGLPGLHQWDSRPCYEVCSAHPGLVVAA